MAGMETLGTEHLCQIARNGGGMRVSSVLGKEHLAKIARNLSGDHALLIVTNAAVLGTEALCHIARNGDGKVLFE